MEAFLCFFALFFLFFMFKMTRPTVLHVYRPTCTCRFQDSMRDRDKNCFLNSVIAVVFVIVIIPVGVADGQVEITNDQVVEGVELDLVVLKEEGVVVVDEGRGQGLDPGLGQGLVVGGEMDTE